jgi:mRNA interferase RelE/StbE
MSVARKAHRVRARKRGRPLGSRATSNHTGPHKLVVGDRESRIVFRVEPDGSVCVVWVMGRRSDDEVYEIAESRVALYSEKPSAPELGGIVDAVFGKPLP